MGNIIHTIPLGFDQTYIIKDQGTIMIDGGDSAKGRVFLKNLEKISIKPKEIKLIILTHGHWDHIGSTAEIKEISGAKAVMHKNEKHWLEKSLKPMPPGVTTWGVIFGKLVTWGLVPFKKIPATDVDIVLGDEEFPLYEYGIAGKVVHTPGHSSGSVSILLDTGEAFVGDLAMNKFPLCLKPGLPILAEDLSQVRKSWQKLLDSGAETIYPAHGEPFSIDVFREELLRNT